MKIVLTTFGSRGDVQPMLALALALKSKGHQILLAGPPEKSAWALELGCPYKSLGSDLTAFVDTMKNTHSPWAAFQFVSYVRQEVKAQFDSLPQIIDNADLVIGASLVLALSSIAEKMKIPYRYIAFTPQLLPSDQHPHPACSFQNLPELCNRMTWTAARAMDRFNFTGLINKKRKHMGLKRLKDCWPHVLSDKVIVCSDKAIAEVPTDVDVPWTQTGYMHLEQPKQDNPGLEAFLNSGPSPIYAGFGSMPKKNQIKSMSLIVKAARAASQRVVLARFWKGLSDFDHEKDVFFINQYPHLKLFPRMSAVIHHGGAGTTATTAISNVPQIIVPHALDQYYWGHRIYQSGLGTKPIWRSGLTSGKLAAAIMETQRDRQLSRNAEEVAMRIKQKNGVEMTVNEIFNLTDK